MDLSPAPLPNLPLVLGALDHYTLIVPDAAAVAAFHVGVLGFRPLRIQRVNAGSVPQGEHDMLNHVLELPGAPGRVLVVTEGLNPASIFSRYLERYGPGVHHVAYEVRQLEAARAALLGAGVRLTSEEILRDPLTGLRQVFIAREHAGYFVELVERTEAATGGAFTEHNMAALARTMTGYLGEPAPPAAVEGAELSQEIPAGPQQVLEVLASPEELPRWTGHRLIRRMDGQLVEVRMHGDVPLSVERSGSDVTFTWSLGGRALAVTFSVDRVPLGARVRVQLPAMSADRLAKTRAVVAAELRCLGALLAGTEPAPADAALVDAYHLEVHARRGL